MTVHLAEVSEPGAKAENLAWLASRRVRVPETWVVTDAGGVAGLALDPDRRYAVRSSAANEDTAQTAAAGVYTTELDVTAETLAEAVDRVRHSSEGAISSVIVQPMVDPVVSGVSFSRHPVTGLSDTVVEAVDGRGDLLLQDGADPLRWVYRSGEFIEHPDRSDLEDVVTEVVATTRKLAVSFGPADLEWVWDGSDVYWVQIRPITTIDDVPIYSRRIAKDVMPGLIKPLVWSVNVPMVNSAWIRLFTEAVGANDLTPEQLAKSFAYRSYFDMRAIGDIFELTGMPRDSLENLLGLPGARSRMRPGIKSMSKLPRLVVLAFRLVTGAKRFEATRAALQDRFDSYATRDLAPLREGELLTEIDDLIALAGQAAYVNIVLPLLANLHRRTLKARLEKSGIDLEEFGISASSDHDPTPLLAELGAALRLESAEVRARAIDGVFDDLSPQTRTLLEETLTRFGHLAENNNDMSTPRWRDDPSILVRLADATREGQSQGADVAVAIDGLSGLSRRRAIRALRRFQRFADLREAAGSTFAFGYGLLRPRFLELGKRLCARDVLDEPGDVFFLERSTVEGAVSDPPQDLRERVDREKKAMAQVKDLTMPDLIVGDEWVPEPARVSERLAGVGASRGRYRGVARFISTLDDAQALGEGEVLVVDYSDVAWTPLFSKAGAVVTSAGGLLAHSSITAREMGIPCVASVSNARTLDGQTVVVDGYEGVVLIDAENG